METYFRVELCDGGFEEFSQVAQKEMNKGNILLFEGMNSSKEVLVKPIQDCDKSLELMHRLRTCIPTKYIHIMPYRRTESQVG